MNEVANGLDANMACPICSSVMEACFTAIVLNKYHAQYEVCNGCGFLRAHQPHWLEEAYSSAIALADTGLVARNIAIANKLAGVLYWGFNERGNGHYLDAAGGYGMLTRLMRDIGFNFYWHDKYCKNLLALGFEYKQSHGRCHAVTAMEVLEHITDPVSFIEETLAFSGADTLLFTTELYEGPPPEPDAWWYYAFSTGQHIGFFQRRTLAAIANRLGLHFATANGIHILSKTAANERLLGAATGRLSSRIALWWVRRRLGSKTISDHHLMLQNIDKDEQ
ncbi:MAG: class I SAM-dependent methyltransferase [Gammaproteobacteria bacterium]